MKLRLLLVAVFLLLCVAAGAAAQFGGAFGGFGRGARPKMPTKDTFGHGFNFCRGMFTQRLPRSRRHRAGPPTIPTPS